MSMGALRTQDRNLSLQSVSCFHSSAISNNKTIALLGYGRNGTRKFGVRMVDGNPASPVPTTPPLDVVTSNYCLIFSSDSKHQREVELLLDSRKQGLSRR